MEPITCVVDAATLIENIHEIKSWTFGGYLNLVVPLSTIERAEQLYKIKKEELEVKVLDPPKKRLSWKNVRKEHPALDINIQLALEFIKEMEIDESNTSVTFQKSSEAYSPWKVVVEVQQEKKEVKEERPSTFAQALAKSNTVNGISGVAKAPKGPVKPKLVAKASGVETSPWKMNKKAPRIPPSEVPEALRPLLSYTLWRLYENVATWSDSNPTVLLSSDPKTSTMARKLNITVKQIGQLRQAIASKKMVKTNRHVSGHLERDFGITISKTSPLKNGKVHTGSENSTSETREDCELNELVDSNSEPSELVVSDRELNGDHGVPGKTEDTLIDGGEKANLAVDQYEQKDFHQPAEQAIATANSDNLKELKRILHISESAPSEDQKLAASPKPAWIASEVDFPLEETEIHTKGTITTGITAEADANIVNKLSAKVENTFDKNDFAPHSARVPIVRHGNLRHENYSEFSQREITSRPATINSASLSSRPSSRESSSLPTQVTQEPEDSDEEVVVFNPRAKRFSAQHKKLPTPNVPDSPKAAGATISATTSVAVAMTTDSTAASTAPAIAPVAAPAIAPTKPPTAPTVVPMIAPTIAPVIAPAIVPATETSPKLASAKANSPTLPYVRISSYKAASGKTNPAKPNHGKHSRPQTPVVQAAIIDPDFFGRSSVVNVRPNIQNGNSRNSPRASPRRGPRIPDSDVDYVLTSGATREAARGRGKLWIP